MRQQWLREFGVVRKQSLRDFGFFSVMPGCENFMCHSLRFFYRRNLELRVGFHMIFAKSIQQEVLLLSY